MIKEFLTYTVICDGCGKDSNEDCDYSGWNEKEYALDVAEEAGFETIDEKHYCIDCYEYDDDDELIVKTKKEKETK